MNMTIDDPERYTLLFATKSVIHFVFRPRGLHRRDGLRCASGFVEALYSVHIDSLLLQCATKFPAVQKPPLTKDARLSKIWVPGGFEWRLVLILTPYWIFEPSTAFAASFRTPVVVGRLPSIIASPEASNRSKSRPIWDINSISICQMRNE